MVVGYVVETGEVGMYRIKQPFVRRDSRQVTGYSEWEQPELPKICFSLATEATLTTQSINVPLSLFSLCLQISPLFLAFP